MFISHVLYRVNDLTASISRLEEAGFVVDVVRDAEKPYHAIVWFKQGPYLEIIKPEDFPPISPELLKIKGNELFVQWAERWKTDTQRWCDFAIESAATDLDAESDVLRRHGLGFKMNQTAFETAMGTQGWQQIVTEDMAFPFLVSAYAIDPRPYKNADHPNGIREVETVLLGSDGLNLPLFNALVTNHNWFTLVAGQGVQTVRFKDSKVSFENIL